MTAPTVGRRLKENGFSLQGVAKTLEGDQHPDRDAIPYINEQVKDHQAAGEPVISVDAKKKEQVGLLPMSGREWPRAGGRSRLKTTVSGLARRSGPWSFTGSMTWLRTRLGERRGRP